MKIIRFLILTTTITFFLNISLFAKRQIIWQNVSSRPLDCKLIDSLNYVIVGDDGKIISSSDGGETWNWLECGLRNIFYSVDFLNLDRGAVVGSDGAFALTTDAGKSWKTGIIDTTTFYAVKMLEENTIFASGKNTCIYKTSDFGDSWKKVYYGDTNTLNNWYFFKDSIYNTDATYYNSNYKFINSSIGFAVGVGPHILKTTDKGENWEKVFEDSDSTLLTAIDFDDEENGIVVGGKLGLYEESKYFGFKPFAVYTSDQGITWKKFEIPIDIGFNGVKYFGKNHIYLVGGSGWSCVTKDKGYSWSKYKYIDYKYYKDNTNIYKDTLIPYGSDYFIQRPSFDSIGNILAISNQGSIFKSNDFGKNYFTIKNCELYDPTVQSFRILFSAINASQKTIVIPSEKSKVFGSFDCGTSWDWLFPRVEYNTKEEKDIWALTTQGDANLLTGRFRDSLFGFLAGKKQVNSKGVPFSNSIITNDGGLSWQFSNNLRTTIPVSFISSKEGFAIHENKFFNNTVNYSIMQTHDAGLTWDSVNVIQLPIDPLEKDFFQPRQIIFPDTSEGYLTLYYGSVITTDTIKYPSGKKTILKIFKSNDYFKTINLISTIEYSNQSAYKIHFVDKNYAYLTKTGNILLKTIDGFQTYEELLMPGYSHYINDFYFLDEHFGIAVGRQDTIFTTEDGGNSWKIEVLPFNRKFSGRNEWTYNFNSISKVTNGNYFLTGRGRIVRGIVIDSTDISVKEETEGIYCPFYYVSVIPNPVLGTAKIKIIGLHYAQGKRLYLRIYDINGNFIKDLSEEANRNNDGQTAEFEAELHDLPNGIYFIELEANNLIRAQKFIKE
jgi:photosystem II stability/assembly factor-like uncharacterized protein